MTKSERMLNKGSDVKMIKDMKRSSFDKYINKEIKTIPKRSIPPKEKSQEQMSDNISPLCSTSIPQTQRLEGTNENV
jgi:hypothetical protein